MSLRVEASKSPAAIPTKNETQRPIDAAFRQHFHGGAVRRRVAENEPDPVERTTRRAEARSPRTAPREDPDLLIPGARLTALELLGHPVAPPRPMASGRDDDVRHALAERYVGSLRVGRAARDAHEARLTVPALRGGDPVDIRLRHEDGRLSATLASDDDARARSLARRVQEELSAAGLSGVDVAIEP